MNRNAVGVATLLAVKLIVDHIWDILLKFFSEIYFILVSSLGLVIIFV